MAPLASSSSASAPLAASSDRVALLAEAAAGEDPHHRPHPRPPESSPCPPRSSAGAAPVGARRAGASGARQVDPERAALARPRCTTQMKPPLCFTMPYTVESPRPVPWPDGLGREERLEDPGLDLRVHAASRCRCTASTRRTAGGMSTSACALGIHLVQRGRAGADGDPSAVPHGVARVEHQVDEHLLELPSVGPDLPDVLGAGGAPGRGPRPASGGASSPSADHRVEVEQLGAEELLAGEGQELAGDVGGAGASLDDLCRPRRGGGLLRPGSAAGTR